MQVVWGPCFAECYCKPKKRAGNIHLKQKTLFILWVSLSDFLKRLAEGDQNLMSCLTSTYAKLGSPLGV